MRIRNNPEAPQKLSDSGYQAVNFPWHVDEKTIIELGMGKGEMLTEMAFRNPDFFYLGIEKYPTIALKAARRAQELNLQNFKIISGDVSNLPSLVEGKVNTVWLTFSDPWPKKYQTKRRLTYKTFLNLYKDILLPGGVIKFKTDNDALFNWTVEHMQENNMILSNVTNDFHAHLASKENIMTGYEKKWADQGKKINYLEARFKA